jgi:hypothetical protein
MSIRLHVASKYEIVWEGGYIANRPEEFRDLLDSLGIEYTIQQELDPYLSLEINGDEEGIKKLERAIIKLREFPEKVHPLFKKADYLDKVTQGELADVLQGLIDHRDKRNDVIIVNWF